MWHGAISRSLSIPRRTVSNFIARLKNRDIRANLEHSGQPRITTTAQNKCIIATAETHTHVPLAELRSITNVDISKSTIHWRLHEVRIRKWRAVKRPLLQEQHAATRLKWMQEHQHKTREDWAKIVWSDEAAIQKDSARQQVWVF